MFEKYTSTLRSIICQPNYSEDASLFHYTTIDSFVNIISTKTFWMNPQQNYFDHQELKLGKELVINEIKNTISSTNLKIEINKIEEFFDRGFFRVTSSFCSKNDISEMWNYYSDHFKGIVIEFKLKRIIELIDIFEEQVYPKKYTLGGFVEYSDHKAKNIIHQLSLTFQKYYNNAPENATDEYFYFMLLYMAAYSLIIKHNYFEYENEFRICCFTIAGKKNDSLPDPEPLTFKKEQALFMRNFTTDYKILFPFEDQDISQIYLIDKNFDQNKASIVNRLQYINGINYSDRIRPIRIPDEVIEKYSPLPIIVK